MKMVRNAIFWGLEALRLVIANRGGSTYAPAAVTTNTWVYSAMESEVEATDINMCYQRECIVALNGIICVRIANL